MRLPSSIRPKEHGTGPVRIRGHSVSHSKFKGFVNFVGNGGKDLGLACAGGRTGIAVLVNCAFHSSQCNVDSGDILCPANRSFSRKAMGMRLPKLRGLGSDGKSVTTATRHGSYARTTTASSPTRRLADL
jgi:hypothetical protein